MFVLVLVMFHTGFYLSFCSMLCFQALIGTYRCTDIPGQFVWQPGSLLCAVTEGHWLLLEDLDCAPMDIVSVLVPLLETGTLSVPGHGGEVHAAPSFRIFATRRQAKVQCAFFFVCIPVLAEVCSGNVVRPRYLTFQLRCYIHSTVYHTYVGLCFNMPLIK